MYLKNISYIKKPMRHETIATNLKKKNLNKLEKKKIEHLHNSISGRLYKT